jgi:hypothetical protein
MEGVVRSNREIRPTADGWGDFIVLHPLLGTGREMATFYVGARRARDGEIAAECHTSSLMLNHASRSLRQTEAQPRHGKHARLSPEERSRRNADRAARRRQLQRKKETFAELAEQRAARQRVREEEAWLKRKTIRVKVAKADRSKVTRYGGRRHYRQRERFERVVLPSWSNTRFSPQTGLVWRIKGRSMGGQGRSRYRRRECSRFARYCINQAALELAPEAAIFTSIVPPHVSRDSDEFARELVTFLDAAEDLEREIDPTGQLYKSIIVPLPHDISPERRRDIAAAYARQFDRHKLPYLLVLHAPDPGGDQRNYHMHALVLTRAFERVGDYEWTFAKTKTRDLFHPAMLKVWRRYTVNLFNHHLTEAGIARRYTIRAVAPVDKHQGRVRTIERRKAVLAAEEKLVEAKKNRSLSEIVGSCANDLVAIAHRHVEIGRTIGRVRTTMLSEIKIECLAAQKAIGEQRGALQLTVMLADLRRRTLALHERRDRLVARARISTLRKDIRARLVESAKAVDHLGDMSRRAILLRATRELAELSHRVRADRADLVLAARMATQARRIANLRDAIHSTAEINRQGRRRLGKLLRNGGSDAGARVRSMTESAARRQAELRKVHQAALRQRALSLRDALATMRMDVELGRLNLPRPPMTGIIAQAARIGGVDQVPVSGVQRRSTAIGPRPIAAPNRLELSAPLGSMPIDLTMFDSAIRDLPASRVSEIASELGDLRAAIRSNQAHLYRTGPNLRVVTDDPIVRAVVGRILNNPAGKSILLSIGRPTADKATAPVSRQLSLAERERLRSSTPTAVPSLHKSPLQQAPSSEIEPAPTEQAPDIDRDRDDDQAGISRGGAER